MADVWKISKENVESYLNSVKEAFDKNYLYWLDNHLRILMAGLNPSTARNFKLGAVGSLGGGFAGYGMYQIDY